MPPKKSPRSLKDTTPHPRQQTSSARSPPDMSYHSLHPPSDRSAAASVQPSSKDILPSSTLQDTILDEPLATNSSMPGAEAHHAKEEVEVRPSRSQECSSTSGGNDAFDTPRPFDTPGENWTYGQGHILNCCESGPSNLLEPAHEFKLCKGPWWDGAGIKQKMKAIMRMAMMFACACLNVRTNGTIHLGVADEDKANIKEYNKKAKKSIKPKEIQGIEIEDISKFTGGYIDAIKNCFKDSREISIAKFCIRQPKFVRVISAENDQKVRYVIEFDIVPVSELCGEFHFTVTLPKVGDETREEEQLYIREGASSRALILPGEIAAFLETTRPNAIALRKKADTIKGTKKKSIQNPEEIEYVYIKEDKQKPISAKFFTSRIDEWTRVMSEIPKASKKKINYGWQIKIDDCNCNINLYDTGSVTIQGKSFDDWIKTQFDKIKEEVNRGGIQQETTEPRVI